MKFFTKKKENKKMENIDVTSTESTAVKMAPPWISYVNAMTAMFKEDKDIKIIYDNSAVVLKIFVESEDKYNALTQILPDTKQFGSVLLAIDVIPPNKESSLIDLYKAAFKDNPVVSSIITISDIPGMTISNPITYVQFRKEVVQYYNDDLSDAHGNKTTLYQDIAKEIFEKKDGIFFCTDNK